MLCFFTKKSKTEFKIIVVYIDDLNLVGTSKEFIETTKYLKKEFEMKVLEKQNFVSACKLSIFQLECRFINQHKNPKTFKYG